MSPIARVFIQFSAGIASGGLGAVAGMFAGAVWVDVGNVPHEAAPGCFLFSIPVGFMLTSPLGVFLVARLTRRTVPFWATYSVSIFLVSMCTLALIIDPRGDTPIVHFLHVVLFAGPLVCLGAAIAGSNWARP